MTEKIRCEWCLSSDLYKKYHDEEWGIPVYEDQKLFEFLLLETFQAGLNWHTILKKRDNFRFAFDNFDYKKIADYSEDKIKQLMQDSGIIRNQLKIRSTVSNAQAFIAIQQQFGSFANYIWKFSNGKQIVNSPLTIKDIPASTFMSDLISKDLKKQGIKFVGSTIIYAYMQAIGMVNDHISQCWRSN